MSLLDRLIDRIDSDGPIPFEEFQSAALYDTEDGFFGAGKLRSVKEGDFLTSPEVSPLFGETLSVFVDRVLGGSSSLAADEGAPSSTDGKAASSVPPASGAGDGGKVRLRRDRRGRGAVPMLVEVGAGSGSLLRPLLASLKHPVDAWAVEASPAARSALRAVLPEDRILASIGRLPTAFRGVVIANELVDNLPVALAVRVGDGWEERWVGVEDGRLVLVRHGVRHEVAAWAERFGLPCPNGGRVEVQLAASAWMRSTLGRLDAGALVIIDYGETAKGLEHRRVDGTIRTYRAHHLGPQPLLQPGETDITVDVNFSALMAVAPEEGASVELHRQDEFLESLGLRDRIAGLRERELAAARSGDTMGQLEARSDRTNAETLLHPRGLGDFRVLVARV